MVFLTSFGRLKATKPIVQSNFGQYLVVTNWSASRVFSPTGDKLLREVFHTKKSDPRDTHSRVIKDLDFSLQMARSTANPPGRYQGD